MKMSEQACAAIMVALQKCILEEIDIVEILKSYDFDKSPDTKRWGGKKGELVVSNPLKFLTPVAADKDDEEV